MKFDKETVIVFAICIIVLFTWNPLCQKMGWIQEENKTNQQQLPQKNPDKVEPVPQQLSTPVAKGTTPVPVVVDKTQPLLGNIPPQIISNGFFSMTIDPVSGVVASIKLEKFPLYSHNGKVTLCNGSIPGATAVYGNSGEWKIQELLDNNRGTDKAFSTTRKMVDSKGQAFLMTQQWTISDNYSTSYQITIRNLNKSPLLFEQLLVDSGGIPPLHYLAGDTITSESHCVDLMQSNGDFIAVNADAKDKDFNVSPIDTVQWLGITNKYFCCILLPEKPFDGGVAMHRQKFSVPDKPGTDFNLTSASGVYKNINIEPGKELVLKFKYYAGPKVISEFKKFDPSVSKVMHLSWGPLDWLARVMLVFLVFLKSFCGSYGWSIIVLTIIVRLLFWPVTQKANNSMKRMQKLQPKVTEIRTKHKDNPQQMNAKIMELYKQEGVNPLGGCFPILLQIPVFFALYATLDGAIELRQVSFLWAKDLTLPDTIAVLFNLLPLNPLVLVMTALMVLQQKMTPSPADPMQQKMLMFMPIVMLFVLYSLPSGLTLYWTVSQIFSILQLYATQKFSKDKTTADNKNAKPNLKNA